VPEVADIFRQHAACYIEKFGQHMLPSHLKAINDIIACRTEVLGGHVYECNHCHHEVYAYHSCKNRSCPKCHTKQTEQWLEKRQAELLPTAYFHITLTLPASLRPLFRSNQKVCYGIMMKAASEAIVELSKDPQYCGGLVGILAVLHTWTQQLIYHPHVHCLVTAGGVNAKEEWCPSRDNYLVPVRALSKLFRGKCLAALHKAFPDESLQSPSQWVVFSKVWGKGETGVLSYLARYVFRSAISNCRILSLTSDEVRFRYKDRKAKKWRVCKLTPEVFMQRFLQHVLPKGMHKVRYSGLWHHSKSVLIKRVRFMLELAQPKSIEQPSPDEKMEPKTFEVFHGALCQKCKQGHLVLRKTIGRANAMGP